MNQRVKAMLKKQYYRATYHKYHGHGYLCNFCGASYGRFIPEYPSMDLEELLRINQVISGYGPNVHCPNCMSTNEERLVKAVIQQQWKIEGKQILHFSPERRLYRWLKKRALMMKVNADSGVGHLPFADESFSFLIANHVLDHIAEDRAVLQEMRRVLKPDGSAIIQVLYSESLSASVDAADLRMHIYAKKDFLKGLEKAGFRVKVLTPEALKSFRCHAIQEDESVFLCYK